MNNAADSWEELRQTVDRLEKKLARSPATHVNAKASKEAAKTLVQSYFRVVRPELQSLGIDNGVLSDADSEMQALLTLANGRHRKSAYLSALRAIRDQCSALEGLREVHLGEATVQRLPVHSQVEVQISETLQQLVPSASLSYRQALLDLQDQNRLSFRGTANELREALRETLDHLSPDSDVEHVEGFKLEKNRTKPTQKQKVQYILRSRGLSRTARKTPEATTSLIDELTASVTRASFDRGNLSTHIASSGREVRQLKMYVDSVLAELLEIH
ncbi:MAG: hypothetical protein ACJ75T_04565 [Solirubrobacterales bacterium]